MVFEDIKSMVCPEVDAQIWNEWRMKISEN